MLTIAQLLTLLRKSGAAWNTDDASSMGAALAFYTLFSIAPLVVMVIAVASLIFGPDAAQAHILGELRTLTGSAGAQAVAELLKSANSPAKSVFTALIGTVILLLGATTVFNELYGNLNRIWRSPTGPKASGVWHLLRTRIAWHDVWIGAIVTAVLFEIGKLLIGLVGMATITSAFGPAGSLVVLLIWVYYSAQVFLLGAEFTRVYAYREGSRADEEPPAPPPQRQGRPLKAKK